MRQTFPGVKSGEDEDLVAKRSIHENTRLTNPFILKCSELHHVVGNHPLSRLFVCVCIIQTLNISDKRKCIILKI
jgi:hypothetical protein